MVHLKKKKKSVDVREHDEIKLLWERYHGWLEELVNVSKYDMPNNLGSYLL